MTFDAETGPTMYLPHSQKYLPGYLAWRRPAFREYFQAFGRAMEAVDRSALGAWRIRRSS